MSALVADVERNMTEDQLLLQNYVETNGTQVFVGSYLYTTAAGTSSPFVAGAGNICNGIAVGPGVPGSDPNTDGFATPPASSIAPGNGKNQVVINQGQHKLINVLAITAAAGTQADVGKKVYLLNDNDLTVTQPGSDEALGEVQFFFTQGGVNYWNVLVYSYAARRGG